MTPLIKYTEETDLSGYTLIIPSVSVGNVPQLTVDLLITTYGLKKSATIWHPAIVPSVGSDPYYSNSSEICTACEMYTNKKLKLATIQLRSTLESKMTLQFFKDLKTALAGLELTKIVILSSAFDYELRKITSNKFYYISNRQDSELMEYNNVSMLQQNSNGNYYINGAGFAIKLREIISTKLQCTLLGKFVSEGDNRPDACTMLQKLLDISGIQNMPNVSIPSSWKFVFGGPPPVGIY